MTADPRDQVARKLAFENWFGSTGYDDQGRFDQDEMEFAFEAGAEAEREARHPQAATELPASQDARKVLARVFSEFSRPDQHGIRHLSYSVPVIARYAAAAGLAPGEALTERETLIAEVLEALHEVFVPAIAEAFAARFEAAAAPGACSSCGQRGGPYCDDESSPPDLLNSKQERHPGGEVNLITDDEDGPS